ncbi:glutathionylspermidine synthase family protein [Campylobacter sp. faydin G-24]|uniref:Glutathionylspermidine synthase family protein n=1 Tax=Campylobacter anatolicus TaxID=2829105 RepID=A0ABS5HG32_9BACT|nr:glutathionylspermidine synthase family protein [Campylobacter anatolicus]MBR8463239.1 glutathionylspermidine synthase family protein [Campylobacter anatolicus]
MINLKKIQPLNNEFMNQLGFAWHTDADGSAYVADELVAVSSDEAEAYYRAVNELYDMYITAAQHIIDNNLFHEVGIPFNLVDLIKDSWENEVHWHLYGRFDLAGGLDGKPIKLIEFNADTPTAVFETAIIQWAMLKFNKMDEASQFNDLYAGLVENFKRLIVLDGNTAEFDKFYEGWKILFSCVAGSIEDENTTKLLQSAASEAGFETDFAYINEIDFSDENGVFKCDVNYEYLFKLVPWEDIAIQESTLALILKNIVQNQKAIVLNPAYTLLFQSKGILKILWDLYPDHPLLLRTSYELLNGVKCVKKPVFGREGANVSIVEKDGSVSLKNSGEYDESRSVYQEFYEFNADISGAKYQAGVFFAYEGCALGYRKGGEIINNTSKFVGHYIKD